MRAFMCLLAPLVWEACALRFGEKQGVLTALLSPSSATAALITAAKTKYLKAAALPAKRKEGIFQYIGPARRGGHEQRGKAIADLSEQPAQIERCNQFLQGVMDPKKSKPRKPLGFATEWPADTLMRTSNDEDLIAFKNMFLSKDGMTPKRNGFYIEMGAFDGVQESNTRFFELCLGWKGLLIEASPTTFENLKHNRPHNHLVNVAPSCSRPGELTAQISK
jgi:hypothetical protein